MHIVTGLQHNNIIIIIVSIHALYNIDCINK